jgi:hypothetical protein
MEWVGEVYELLGGFLERVSMFIASSFGFYSSYVVWFIIIRKCLRSLTVKPRDSVLGHAAVHGAKVIYRST